MTRDVISRARVMFETGSSITEVSSTLQIAWDSAKKLSKRTKVKDCLCGKRSHHKGKCWIKKAHTRSIEESKPSYLETASQADYTTGKCFEAACPFPSFINFRCRKHYLDELLAYSMVSSTLCYNFYVSQGYQKKKKGSS